MKSLTFSRCALLAVLIIGGSFFSGCSLLGPARPPYNIKIQPGESLKDSSVQVDLVGVNPSELERWRNYSIHEYFKPGDPLRTDALKFPITFVPDQQKEVVLWSTNTIWNNWLQSGAPDQYVIVLADLPGSFPEGKAGTQDPRRQILPLTKKAWSGRDLELRVRADGVTVLTIPKASCLPPGW